MRHMLVDGHGNFGSRDGDAPAAYRYTEARMAKIALEMMGDINKNTVDFKPNFDEHEMEPVVLPARFPNLLVNGSTGIAVGMATNIPPHNLAEVIDGVIMLIHNPQATVEDLMTVIQGPDFPTEGFILGTSGIREAYRTGRGRIVIRAHVEIETLKNNRQRILVHDLPYMVNKARLIERIADLAKNKKIDGISDLRDESDRNDPVRVVIELRRDANANVVLNQLYKHTQLQDAFNANMLALVPDEYGRYEPQMVTLLDALVHYLSHQKEVVARRTRFDLEKAQARRHIVDGLRTAIDHIDEVITIIRSSRTEEMAKKRLMERFAFSDRQAQHIVDMRLGRLTGLEREKLEKEYEDLCEKIDSYQRILAEEPLLMGVVEEELLQIKARYGEPRRTAIEMGEDEIDDESLIQVEDIVVTMTHFGYIKRMPVDTCNIQHRGGRGVSGIKTREEDFAETLLITSTHDVLLFFTNRGRVFKLKGYQIPQAGRQARGTAIVNLLQLDGDEKVKTVIPISSFDDPGHLIMATRYGLVKKTLLSDFTHIYKSGLIAINLREDDKLVHVQFIEEACDVILVTRQGLSIRFDEEEVRATGRNTQGVIGIGLDPEDEVIGMVLTRSDRSLLVVSERGFGKRTDLDDYRPQKRGGKGLITYRPSEKTGLLAGIALVAEEHEVILINDSGIMIRIAAAEIPILGRITQGVTLMRTGEDRVVDMAVVEAVDCEDEDTDDDL